MSKIKKNGIVLSPALHEDSSLKLAINSDTIYTYTPTKVLNSCLSGYKIDYTGLKPQKLGMHLVMTWHGFDKSNTDGTFGMWFQGSNYNTASAADEWKGVNAVCVALNAAKYPRDLVLSKTSGTYVYNITYDLTEEFLNTYSKSWLGLRTDYSNGTAWVQISDLKIYSEKDFTSGGTNISSMKVSNKSIITHDFIEY